MDDKEFNEWVAKSIPAMTQGEMFRIKAAWNESARRADKRVIEKCLKIVWSTVDVHEIRSAITEMMPEE